MASFRPPTESKRPPSSRDEEESSTQLEAAPIRRLSPRGNVSTAIQLSVEAPSRLEDLTPKFLEVIDLLIQVGIEDVLELVKSNRDELVKITSSGRINSKTAAYYQEAASIILNSIDQVRLTLLFQLEKYNRTGKYDPSHEVYIRSLINDISVCISSLSMRFEAENGEKMLKHLASKSSSSQPVNFDTLRRFRIELARDTTVLPAHNTEPQGEQNSSMPDFSRSESSTNTMRIGNPTSTDDHERPSLEAAVVQQSQTVYSHASEHLMEHDFTQEMGDDSAPSSSFLQHQNTFAKKLSPPLIPEPVEGPPYPSIPQMNEVLPVNRVEFVAGRGNPYREPPIPVSAQARTYTTTTPTLLRRSSNPQWRSDTDHEVQHAKYQESPTVGASNQTEISQKQTMKPNERYRIRSGRSALNFFRRGRVLSVTWAKPAGAGLYLQVPHEKRSDNSMLGISTTKTHDGTLVHTKKLMMLVIACRNGYSICCPISDYGGRGVTMPGLKMAEIQAHAIIHSTTQQPLSFKDEPQLSKKPIPVRMVQDRAELDPGSRVHFGKYHTLEWSVPVMNIGVVDEGYEEIVRNYFVSEFSGS